MSRMTTYEEDVKRSDALYKMAQEVAALLKGWTADPPNKEHRTKRFWRIHKDGVKNFGLFLEYEKDKLNVSPLGWPEYTYWPEGEDRPRTQAVTPRGNTPRISVTFDRGPEAVVREIGRRLMGEYEQLWNECVTSAAAYGNSARRPWEGWQAVCAATGGDPKRGYVYVTIGGVQLSISRQGGESIKVEFSEKAEAVCAVLDALRQYKG